jgi:hypothetical protein
MAPASIRLLNDAADSGRMVHFDLTNMDDLAGIVQGTSVHQNAVTTQEFLHIVKNWKPQDGHPGFEKNVKFYFHDQEWGFDPQRGFMKVEPSAATQAQSGASSSVTVSQRTQRPVPRPFGSPTVEWSTYDENVFTARWPNDPAAVAEVRVNGDMVDITGIWRGSQPPGSAGAMIADSLREVKVTRPAIVRVSATNETTTQQIQRGQPINETQLGQTLSNTVQELGGTTVNWRIGNSGGRPFIEATVQYGERVQPGRQGAVTPSSQPERLAAAAPRSIRWRRAA